MNRQIMIVTSLMLGLGHGVVHDELSLVQRNAGVQTPASEGAAVHEDTPSVPQMLCSGFERPKVALCLYGAARSFVNTLGHKTIQANLVQALGADTTTFVNTKLADNRGDVTSEFHGLFPTATREQLQVAVNAIGAAPENVRAVDEADTKLPNCSSPQWTQGIARQMAHDHGDHIKSLAGQIDGRAGCVDMINEHENRTSTRFDYIIVMRIDMTVYMPFKPYCMYNLNTLRKKYDYLYMGPRDNIVGSMAHLHEQFFGCKEFFDDQQEIVENYVFRHIPNYQDDNQVPIQLTRLNQTNMPNNFCSAQNFVNSGAMESDPKVEDICLQMTFQNRYNSVP